MPRLTHLSHLVRVAPMSLFAPFCSDPRDNRLQSADRKDQRVCEADTAEPAPWQRDVAGAPKNGDRDDRPSPLQNGGASCYMNATLQGLWACKAARGALDAKVARVTAAESRRLLRLTLQARTSRKKLQADLQHELLLTEVWKTATATRAPRTQAVRAELLLNQYHLPRGSDQQDAQEFLVEILDNPARLDLTAEIEASNADTPLSALLQGAMHPTYRCARGHVSRHMTESGHVSGREFFQTLAVPIETQDGKPITELSQAWERLQSGETMAEEFRFRCPTCASQAPPTKKWEFARMPRILCLQLLRYSFHRDTGAPKVLRHTVQQKLHEIFCDVAYELRGVVFHAGSTCNSGHYWAVTQHDTKDGRKWWLYDDSRRREATVTETVTSSTPAGEGHTYILFFERVDSATAPDHGDHSEGEAPARGSRAVDTQSHPMSQEGTTREDTGAASGDGFDTSEADSPKQGLPNKNPHPSAEATHPAADVEEVWQQLQTWHLVPSNDEADREMHARTVKRRITEVWPGLGKDEQRRYFRAMSSFFGPHYVFACAAVRGSTKEFQEWCAIGRGSEYGTGLLEQDIRLCAYVREVCLQPLVQMHRTLPALLTKRIAFRGCAFDTYEHLEECVHGLEGSIGTYPESYTLNPHSTSMFHSSLRLNKLLARKHQKSKYPETTGAHGLIIVLSGFALVPVSEWNHMNQTEEEVWPRRGETQSALTRCVTKQSHEIQRVLSRQEAFACLPDTVRIYLLQCAEKFETTLCFVEAVSSNTVTENTVSADKKVLQQECRAAAEVTATASTAQSKERETSEGAKLRKDAQRLELDGTGEQGGTEAPETQDSKDTRTGGDRVPVGADGQGYGRPDERSKGQETPRDAGGAPRVMCATGTSTESPLAPPGTSSPPHMPAFIRFHQHVSTARAALEHAKKHAAKPEYEETGYSGSSQLPRTRREDAENTSHLWEQRKKRKSATSSTPGPRNEHIPQTRERDMSLDPALSTWSAVGSDLKRESRQREPDNDHIRTENETIDAQADHNRDPEALREARRLGNAVSLEYRGFLDRDLKFKSDCVPANDNWTAYWRAPGNIYYGASITTMRKQKHEHLVRLTTPEQVQELATYLDQDALYLGFGFYRKQTRRYNLITDLPPCQYTKKYLWLRLPGSHQATYVTSLKDLQTLKMYVEVGCAGEISLKYCLQDTDDFDAPPSTEVVCKRWRYELGSEMLHLGSTILINGMKEVFAASYVQIAALRKTIDVALALTPTYVFAGYGSCATNRHMQEIPAPDRIRHAPAWWCNTQTGLLVHGSLHQVKSSLSKSSFALRRSLVQNSALGLCPPLRLISQSVSAPSEPEALVQDSDVFVWRAMKERCAPVHLTCHEILELRAYQELASKLSSCGIPCVYLGAHKPKEIPGRVQTGSIPASPKDLHLCESECVCRDLFAVIDSRISANRTNWYLNGVVVTRSYEAMALACRKACVDNRAGTPEDSLELTRAHFITVGEYYGLEYLGQVHGHLDLADAFNYSCPHVEALNPRWTFVSFLGARFDASWWPTASDTKTSRAHKVWWRRGPDGEPFALSYVDLTQSTKGEVLQAIARESVEITASFLQKVFAKHQLKYLGPLATSVESGVQSGQSVIQHRCDPTAVGHFPADAPGSQRQAFWRAPTGDIFRASFRSILTDFAKCWHSDVNSYRRLAGRMAWSFLGAGGSIDEDKTSLDPEKIILALEKHTQIKWDGALPSKNTLPAFWKDASGHITHRSYINVQQTFLSRLPTSKSVSILVNALMRETGCKLEAITLEHVSQCLDQACSERVLKQHFHNAKMSLRLRNCFLTKRQKDERFTQETGQACTTTGATNSEDSTAADLDHIRQIRLNALHSHVVPAHPQAKPRSTSYLEDTLKKTCPDYNIFIQYGKDLLVDDFVAELEAYFDEVADGVAVPPSTPSEQAQDMPVVASRLCEALPIPHCIKMYIRSMNDFEDPLKRLQLRKLLYTNHNCICEATPKETWLEDTMRLLHACAQISWKMLCRYWDHKGVCNTDSYRIRTLSIISAQERREALEPLYSRLCAVCGRMLGADVGSDVYSGEPRQVRYHTCAADAQPPFLLLWSPMRLAQEVPTIFEHNADEDALYFKGRADAGSIPPWILPQTRGDECRWAYCRNCYLYMHRKTEKRVPMRNVLELMRTQLHIDKCKDAIYAELRKDIAWWPDTTHVTAEAAQTHFLKQWKRLEEQESDLGAKLQHLYNSCKFETRTDLLEALQKEVTFRTWDSSKGSAAVDEDLTNKVPDLDAEPDPEVRRVMQDMLLEGSVAEKPRTPIPEEFFAGESWTWTGNLLETTHPVLWQDTGPAAPFHRILSQEARTAVSLGRIYSHFKRTRAIRKQDGSTQRFPCYSHASGSMQTKARFPCEDVGMLGIVAVSQETKEQYFTMSRTEWSVVEQCVEWLKEQNIWIKVYKSNLEVMHHFNEDVLQTAYADGHDLQTADGRPLAELLGKEDMSLVVTDLSEYSGQYGHLLAAMDKIGTCMRRTSASDNLEKVGEANETARHEDARAAAAALDKLSHISFADVNLDAKLFTHLHPHGTGSYKSIPECVDFPAYLQARLHDVDSSTRRDRLWPFFQEDRKLKMALESTARFTKTETAGNAEGFEWTQDGKYLRRHGKRPRPEIATLGSERQRMYYQHKYGSRVASTQVDSRQYHQRMKQDFLTVIRPENRGTPTGMLTFVGNDRSAEIRAMLHKNLGPLAEVPQEYHIAHMFRSSMFETEPPPIYEDPAVVTIAYMRKLKRLKQRLLRRGSFDTFLGVLTDYITRCEEQQRKMLHEHIPFMCERCGPDCQSLSRYCTRNPHNKLPPEILRSAHDNVHKTKHMSYIQTELVRPHVIGHDPTTNATVGTSTVQGGTHTKTSPKMTDAMTEDDLYVGYFIRRTQIQFMLHRCSKNYCCAKGACRFFFPYTKTQHEQRQDHEIDRISHIRRHIPDDKCVAAHNLECLLYAQAPCQVQLFDPVEGGRMAGVYAVRYCGKEERRALLETVHPDDTEVSEYLKTKTIGACMAIFRHNGGKICEMHNDVMYFAFAFEENQYYLRPLWHQHARSQYPHQLRFLSKQEKYLLRPVNVRHLRVDSWQRYYNCLTRRQALLSDADAEVKEKEVGSSERGYSRRWRQLHQEEDDPEHPHYDRDASNETVGTTHTYAKPVHDLVLRRRANTNLGFVRTWIWAPAAEITNSGRSQRDHFFESRLFRSLAWYRDDQETLSVDIPAHVGATDANAQTQINFEQICEEIFHGKEDRMLVYEPICQHLEKRFTKFYGCSCCAGQATPACSLCANPLSRVGFHVCCNRRHQVWRPGTLWDANKNLGQNYLWDLVNQGLGLKFIVQAGERLVAAGVLAKVALQETVAHIGAECQKEVVLEKGAGINAVQYTHEAVPPGESNSEATEYDPETMNQVWNTQTQTFETNPAGTSQFKAYEQLCFRQQMQAPIIVAIHAGAGYGKSFMLCCFIEVEKKAGRAWAILAPSGVAAVNIGGVTLHNFFRMRADYSSGLEPESDEARRLLNTPGLLIDEFTMKDTRFYNKMKKLCQEYPLEPHLRKPGALPHFGYRDMIICGDLFQLPPASGFPPLVTHPDFRHLFEFFVLRENRRQERNPEYGRMLDLIKRGGGLDFPTMHMEERSGAVDARVYNFFKGAFIRGFNVSGCNVSLEDGVAMTSYRRYKDRWCDQVADQIEQTYPDCDKIDVRCVYTSPHGEVEFDPGNQEHQRNKQQYPKILRLRTHPAHQGRLMLLRNIDVSKRLANGVTLRLLPRRSWSVTPKRDLLGSHVARPVSVHTNPDLQIYVQKDDQRRRESMVQIEGVNAFPLGYASEETIDAYGLGPVTTLPVSPAYACTVHKGQGLTIRQVLAMLEGLFAHGQVYVLTSRTPLEKDFSCVGVPPKDLLVAVLSRVQELRIEAERLLRTLQNQARNTHEGDDELELPQDVLEQIRNEYEPGILEAQVHQVQAGSEPRAPQLHANRLIDAIEARTKELIQKYDLKSGVETMLDITNEFACSKHVKGHEHSVEDIAESIHHKRETRRDPKQPPLWPNLAEALCPDVRATAVYCHIVQWIENDEVDVISSCVKGRPHVSPRESGEGARTGAIQGRPEFCFGQPLPDKKTRWWGGGKTEQSTSESEEEDVETDERANKRQSIVAALSSGIRRCARSGKLTVERTVIAHGGDAEKPQKLKTKTALKRKAVVLEAPAAPKKPQAGKTVGVRAAESAHPQRPQMSFWYLCANLQCGQRLRVSKEAYQKYAGCRFALGYKRCKHCHRKTPARRMRCARCKLPPWQCSCTRADMTSFRVGGRTPHKKTEAEPEMMYFLRCPGICGDVFRFPGKPFKQTLLNRKLPCTLCAQQRLEGPYTKEDWRHRLMTATCVWCNEAFSNCACTVASETAAEHANRMRLDAAGAKARAKARSRQKTQHIYRCHGCAEVIDPEQISPYRLEASRAGKAGHIYCPECKSLKRYFKTPVSVLTCPVCEATITSSKLDGTVNIHRKPDHTWCHARFRFCFEPTTQTVHAPWTLECLNCNLPKDPTKDFSNDERRKQIGLRRCRECTRLAEFEHNQEAWPYCTECMQRKPPPQFAKSQRLAHAEYEKKCASCAKEWIAQWNVPEQETLPCVQCGSQCPVADLPKQLRKHMLAGHTKTLCAACLQKKQEVACVHCGTQCAVDQMPTNIRRHLQKKEQMMLCALCRMQGFDATNLQAMEKTCSNITCNATVVSSLIESSKHSGRTGECAICNHTAFRCSACHVPTRLSTLTGDARKNAARRPTKCKRCAEADKMKCAQCQKQKSVQSFQATDIIMHTIYQQTCQTCLQCQSLHRPTPH